MDEKQRETAAIICCMERGAWPGLREIKKELETRGYNVVFIDTAGGFVTQAASQLKELQEKRNLKLVVSATHEDCRLVAHVGDVLNRKAKTSTNVHDIFVVPLRQRQIANMTQGEREKENENLQMTELERMLPGVKIESRVIKEESIKQGRGNFADDKLVLVVTRNLVIPCEEISKAVHSELGAHCKLRGDPQTISASIEVALIALPITKVKILDSNLKRAKEDEDRVAEIAKSVALFLPEKRGNVHIEPVELKLRRKSKSIG